MRYMSGYAIGEPTEEEIQQGISRLRTALDEADCVLVGAGAGLSTSSGLTYSGERFEKNFSDFAAKYHAHDMYSLGFANFETPEEQWSFFCRLIMCNRYEDAPKDTYKKVFDLVKDKDYFVITTNVDHQFQKVGFDKQRLFYTQGDYGLWQCSVPCHDKTYDNEEQVRRMYAEQQGMRVPSELVPTCPVCGEPMTMNLRADDTFVEDKGWREAAQRYRAWLQDHLSARILFLELGVGGNTPAIIKYPFWRYAMGNVKATYACLNLGEAFGPADFEDRSIYIDCDIDRALSELLHV